MNTNQLIWQYCAFVSQSKPGIQAINVVKMARRDHKQQVSDLNITHDQELFLIRQMALAYRQNSHLHPRELANRVLNSIDKEFPTNRYAGYRDKVIAYLVELWNWLVENGVDFYKAINW